MTATQGQNDEHDLSGYGIVTRHIVMERHLNAFGNLFGGQMLAWLDEGSALYVMEEIGYANFVTVSMAHVSFRTPAHRGDAVAIYCKVLDTGRASVTVRTRAYAHEPAGQKREIITCEITFVCLKDGAPYKYFQTKEYRDFVAARTKARAEQT